MNIQQLYKCALLNFLVFLLFVSHLCLRFMHTLHSIYIIPEHTRIYSHIPYLTEQYSTIWKDDDGTFIGTCMRCYHGYLLTVYTYSTVEQCTLQYFCVATSLINPLLCWYTFFTWVPNFFVSCSTSCDKIVGFCILAQIILLLFSKMQWKYDIS